MKRVVFFSLALALAAGCGGAGITPGPGSRGATVEQTSDAGPRLAPNCCARIKTLFVTDAFGGSSFTGTVYAFDYETGRLLGQLPAPPEGWLEVQGACVDNGGNAYFANTSLSTIDEYSHDGTYLATIQDPGQYPAWCSYDPTTGNLAVANVIDVSGGSGSISIFKDGVLQNTYHPPNLTRVFSVGYQDGTAGVLWLSGNTSSGSTLVYTFANGQFTRVTFHGLRGGSIGGGFQWSAKMHAMNTSGSDATGHSVIWQFTPAAKIVGKTILDCDGSVCDVVSFFIKGPRVTTADAVHLNAPQFDYPKGGRPIKNYPAPYVQPIGVAVSPNVP